MLRFALSLAAVRYNFVPFLVLCVAVSLVVRHGFLVLSVALFHVELCLFVACFLRQLMKNMYKPEKEREKNPQLTIDILWIVKRNLDIRSAQWV